jgi:sugar phosphate isomerase/epimerase
MGLAGKSFGAADEGAKPKGNTTFKLGIATYTFRHFGRAETLDMIQQLDIKYLAFKSMHLPLDSSAENIGQAVKQVNDKGLILYGGGVIYMKNAEQVSQAFEYAKKAGMKTIIGVPSHDLLDMVDAKVKQYDITVAIHNHGPGDKLYPDPKSIYDRVKGLDPRIGICMDIGHTQRCGLDPSREAVKFADRLYDVHIKDVDKATAKGTGIEIGRGIIDIPEFVRTLGRINYKGIVSFEYEKDGKAPMVGLAESIGYIKGVMAAL